MLPCYRAVNTLLPGCALIGAGGVALVATAIADLLCPLQKHCGSLEVSSSREIYGLVKPFQNELAS